MGKFCEEISLSLRISCVIPCLTAISASFCILFIASAKLSFSENVQFIIIEFLPKKLINLLNCELDKIGLFKT